MSTLVRLGLPILLLSALLQADSHDLMEAVRKAADYSRRGQQQEAAKATAEAVALVERSSGPADFSTAAALNDLAALAYAQGDLNRAGRLFQRSREAYQVLVPPDDVRLATVQFNLAGVYVEQGKYAQAEPLYRSSLAIREKARGAGDPRLAEGWNDLGFAFLQQREYKEAEAWLQKALAVWENATGSELAYAAIALNNLALLRRMQGDWNGAESFYKRALEVEEKVFGRDHPELATTYMNLAALYRARGTGEQAITTYRQALATLEKTVGAQDPLAIDAREQLSELSGAADQRGQFQILVVRQKPEAEELRRRVEQGESFADLAARYSVDPNRSNGGYVRARAAELRPELRAALEGLKPRQVSAAFQLGGNWAIVKKITE
jgi:tetratricopeptide (TPR) repeat protein